MTQEEFKKKVDEMFSEFNSIKEWNETPNCYQINKSISIHFGIKEFGLYEKQLNKFMYESSQFNNFDQFYDELIIFKELILPKYL